MDELIALSKIVSKQKIKQLDVLFDENDLSPVTKKFYSGLADSSIKNDLDAVRLLYDDDKISSKYRKLKSRLRDKLLNTIFFIDVQQFSRSDYESNLVKNYFLLSAIRIIRAKGFLKASRTLAEATLAKSLKYDMVDISFLLISDLFQYFTAFNYDSKKSKHYSKLLYEIEEIFLREQHAKLCFTYYGKFISRNISYDSNETPEDIIKKMIDIEGFLGSINTYDFNYQARNALYFKAYLENDLDRMIDLSKDAVAFFKTKEGFLKLGEFSFLQKLGIAYQARKEYSNALDVYHQAFKLNPREGNTPWYNIRNHIFNVHLHLREYQEAYKYLLEATSHKSFKQLYNLSKEPWILKEAYMHLLIKMGKVAEDKDSKHKLRPFRLSRFLNEVEHFSKDKRGLNIAVNIIHALFLFLQKKDDEFERRLAALGQYSFRYLRRDETLRSNAFIKMLQKLPDAGFHPLRVKRYTDKYYKRMVEAPMVIQENSKEVEIIPYEHLWEIVLELLEMRLNKEI